MLWRLSNGSAGGGSWAADGATVATYDFKGHGVSIIDGASGHVRCRIAANGVGKVDLTDGVVIVTDHASVNNDAGGSTNRMSAYAPATCARIWTRVGHGSIDLAQVTAGDVVLRDDSINHSEVVVVGAASGQLRWQTTIPPNGRFLNALNGIVTVAAQHVVVARDVHSGRVLARLPTAAAADDVVLAGRAGLGWFVQDDTPQLTGFDFAGARRWRIHLTAYGALGAGVARAVGKDTIVLLGLGTPTSAYDAATGAALWTSALMVSPAEIAGGAVVFSVLHRVVAMDARSGMERWHKDVKAIPVASTIAGTVILAGPTTIVGMDAQFGVTRWTLPGVPGNALGSVSESDTLILVHRADGLYGYEDYTARRD